MLTVREHHQTLQESGNYADWRSWCCQRPVDCTFQWRRCACFLKLSEKEQTIILAAVPCSNFTPLKNCGTQKKRLLVPVDILGMTTTPIINASGEVIHCDFSGAQKRLYASNGSSHVKTEGNHFIFHSHVRMCVRLCNRFPRFNVYIISNISLHVTRAYTA